MSVVLGYLLEVQGLVAHSEPVTITQKAMTAREQTALTKYPQWHLEYQRIWINIASFVLVGFCSITIFFVVSNLFLHLQLWKGFFERGKKSGSYENKSQIFWLQVRFLDHRFSFSEKPILY